MRHSKFISRFRAMSILLLSLLAANCAGQRVDLSDPGEISGRLVVLWDGEDNFIYYPAPGNPLTYKLPPVLAAKLGADKIVMTPGAIFTDGGSIPRPVRGVVGFSPWGYGPAYIIHDWLFVVHHCIVHEGTGNLRRTTPDQIELAEQVDFPTSADILAGVIRALAKQEWVPQRALAPDAIYTAVDSVIAKRLWDSRDPKSCNAPTEEQISKIETDLGRTKGLFEVPVGEAEFTIVYDQTF